MASNIVPINQEKHAKLKLRDGTSFVHVADKNIIPIVVYEFTLCAPECPIVFLKGQETGLFQPVALMGFKPGENYFVKDNIWQGMFVPGVVASHPFRLVPNPNDENQLFMAIDMESDRVNEAEGKALFNDDGSESEFFAKTKEDVTRFFEFTQLTENFCKLLEEMDLLTARDLNLDVEGEKITIQSVYLVDDEKLNKLSDDKFLELRRRGFLPAIYAHRNSLGQVRRLAEMRMGRR